jgi:hypothetical protein
MTTAIIDSNRVSNVVVSELAVSNVDEQVSLEQHDLNDLKSLVSLMLSESRKPRIDLLMALQLL